MHVVECATQFSYYLIQAHACAGAAELAAPGGTLVYVGCPTPVTMDIGAWERRALR